MLNKIFLMGRLVADPELKQTPSGVPVSTFRIAVDRDFKNKETGNRDADFVTIVAWRCTAEFVDKHFTKGSIAVVVGRLQIRQYTDKDGNKRSATEVVAENVYFGDSRRDGDGGGSYSGYPNASSSSSQSQPSPYDAPVPAGDQFTELDDEYGELPFINEVTLC